MPKQTNPVSLITDNINIWSSAIQNKKGVGRGSSKKINLYGIKKLRKLILDMAVRGLLIPQNLDAEPASILLERIRKEKSVLITSKRIKKPNELPEITIDESPFSPPNGWEIVRLGDIGYWAIGSGFPKTAQGVEDEKYLFSKVSDMNLPGNEKFLVNTVNTVSQKTVDNLRIKIHPKGAVIFPKIGGAIATNKRRILVRPTAIDNNCLGLIAYSGVEIEYLYLILTSIDMSEYQAGTSVPALSQSVLELICFGIPPNSEQLQIVTKVNELMTLCDQLEQQQENSITAHKTLVETLLAALTNAANKGDFESAWKKIADHFDTLFTTEHSIDQLKQTILQLAVMGKLVPQNPNDEPASVLLEKIAAEKERLVKEKKIKTQKGLPEIKDDEKPFVLPNGWVWCRLPDIGELARGKSKHRPRNDRSLYVDGEIKLIQTGDVARSNGIIQTYTALYNEIGLAQSRLWPKGTMCITIAANIADTGILGFDACFPDSVVGFSPYDERVAVEYFEYFIRTAKSNLEAFAPSTAQKNINLEILGQLLVPFPPVEELIRIVSKIENFMALCDSIKNKINSTQITQLYIADAMAEQAII